MPEIKPVLNKISAFDAKNGTTISFSWTGAQSQKNRIVIKEYDTHKIVYDCTQKTMALKHTLHIEGHEETNIAQNISYGLVNGKRYLATVYIYDVYDNESLPSREIAFYCFSTPIFSFTNFTNIRDNIARVSTNSIYLNVKYTQSNGEKISEYKFRLLDNFGNELNSSQTFYGSTADDTLQWTLGGITDTEKQSSGELNYNSAYKIICEAVTIHGMSLYVEQDFVVQKDTGGVGALVTLESLPDHTISISSHFKITNVSLDGGEEKYVEDSNKNPFAIDLTDGKSISYFDGFNMNAPWSITAIVGNCNPNSTLMKCTNNSGDSFTISYIVKEYPLSSKAYFYFQSIRKNTHYILRSDYLPPSNKWYIIHVKYTDGYYTFRVFDPEELDYELPTDVFPDKILSNKENIFTQKNMVNSSDVTVGETQLNFSMPVDFGDKYVFEPGNYYEITFSADNLVKNNYNDFMLFKSNDFFVIADDFYIKQNGIMYVINYHCTEDIPSPKININWSNKCTVKNIKDYYNSTTYCVIKNVNVYNLLEGFENNKLYKRDIVSTSIEFSTVNNNISLDLIEEGFSFINGYKYLIKFSFDNIVMNGAGIELSKTKFCTAELSDISVSGNVFELEYIHNDNQPNPILTITWINEYNCFNIGGVANSFAVIGDMDVIDIEHPDILEGKTYQYISKNSVPTNIGTSSEEFSIDFRIDKKYLTDSTRIKDKYLTDGEKYIIRFDTEFLCDQYYGISINKDVTFVAEFLGQCYSFKSGDCITLPFVYAETKEYLNIHITWIQSSKNTIESKYSRGETYLLINNIQYGYEELISENICDYDYAAKLTINNIDSSTNSAFTTDIEKTFSGSGSYKLKELLKITEEDFSENNGLISPCNIKMRFSRVVISPNDSHLINISTLSPSISLDGNQLEFSFNSLTNMYQAETTNSYLSIDENSSCNFFWNETVNIYKDLSDEINQQEVFVFILVWVNKTKYLDLGEITI